MEFLLMDCWSFWDTIPLQQGLWFCNWLHACLR